MRIETIRIQNFKSLQSVDLTDLPSFCAFVGRNGSGKTTLFRTFAFLKSCLETNVRTALNREGGRNGFSEVVTRGHLEEAIEIEIQFRMEIAGKNRLVTYALKIENKDSKPVVAHEELRYKRGRYGSPYRFLNFQYGEGYAITNEEDFTKPDEELEREFQKLTSPDTLAIKGLGQFDKFKAAQAFRTLIEQWHISDFHIGDARGVKDDDDARHLSASGDNLPSVARFLMEHHPERFEEVKRKMRERVPGVDDIEVKLTEDGRLLMRYKDGAFKDPFIDKNVSDGTVKMFAYLILLHDPLPHPILCVEEPENQLYPELMEILAEEFMEYASRGGQVFVSTHSPQFLNAVPLDSLYLIEKEKGISAIHRVKNDKILAEQVAEGWKPGTLWEQGEFNGVANRLNAGI
ncbi:AAA family ATPase [Roseibacillus persicicus]|uniref:ATPase n=1 Tax=Roseibacillus persicicus TaxID=454148 RepID=A0A918TCE6_9BACT|nr:AAA family ATPase [Roseibacillus persicicus]GHC41210.1 ATPase [Roseibacillus persicicus]